MVMVLIPPKCLKLYTPPHRDNIPLYMAAVGPEAIKTAALHCDALAPVGKTTLLTSLFHTAPQAARWGAITLVGFFKSKG